MNADLPRQAPDELAGLASQWNQLRDGLAPFRDDDPFGTDLVEEGKAALLELRSLDGLHQGILIQVILSVQSFQVTLSRARFQPFQPREVDALLDLYTLVYMALSIKDPEADRLARELAEQTGETLTQAVVSALRERLARQQRKKTAPARRERLRALRESMRDLPVLDARSPDEILGYGDDGLPR